MRKFTIAIIVDNPLRDLDGCVLLAHRLADAGIPSFLVPMYQAYEIFSLGVNLVIFNYVRPSNCHLVKLCRDIGIKTSVLDTEGGILQDLEEYFGLVAPYLKDVDLYYLWGRKQHECLRKKTGLSGVSLKVTGHPRFDFCHSKLHGTMENTPFGGDKMVLVNTNFTISRPKFQSREDEVEDLISVWNKSRESVESLLAQEDEAVQAVEMTVKTLAMRFSDVQFVIRPHPFEDGGVYRKFFEGFANVHICQEGSVLPWIRDSLMVIHHNCSTAVEAAMMGRVGVHLDWPKTPDLEQPTAREASYIAESIDNVADLLSDILKGGYKLDPQLLKCQQKILEDYYGGSIGQSVDRVVNDIMSLNTPNSFTGGRRYFLRYLFCSGHYRLFFKYVLFFFLGRETVLGLRQRLTKRVIVGQAKENDIVWVRRLCKNLNGVYGCKVQVGSVGKRWHKSLILSSSSSNT